MAGVSLLSLVLSLSNYRAPGGALVLNALKLAGVAFVGTNVLVR